VRSSSACGRQPSCFHGRSHSQRQPCWSYSGQFESAFLCTLNACNPPTTGKNITSSLNLTRFPTSLSLKKLSTELITAATNAARIIALPQSPGEQWVSRSREPDTYGVERRHKSGYSHWSDPR
jgi:hypothetical protein